jgi:hypothetical protein
MTRRRKNKAIAPAASLMADVSRERLDQLARTAGTVEYGHSGHGHVVTTLRDSPIENMKARGDLTDAQYAAAQKYRHHWTHAGLGSSLASPDLLAVGGAELSYGMPRTEAQAHHRVVIRTANIIAASVSSLAIAALEHVVCYEQTLLDFGFAMGHKSRGKAIDATRNILLPVLGKLARHWGQT